jgi:hypothetical protein
MKKIDCCLVLALAAQAAGAEARLAVTVQVFNNASVPPAELRDAVAEAGWMFKKAGIDIDWLVCHAKTERTQDSACAERDHPMLFVLSITSGEAPNGSGAALGYALMQGHSNHAAALYPRIAALVKSHPQFTHSTILGSVLAHELAHLMFRTTEHGEGVMRAQWGRADYQAMAQRKLGFNRKQAERLRKMLAARTASTGVETALRTKAGRSPTGRTAAR